ncbi:RhoGEF [Nesidiocoris tenuis]|uniref:RhoGEF n=1 Tax=Nesidiocoris tenuis TaxID=355587 RepID=A0ABN7ATR9_9HEMI|nr:RhoGEF [Nesidiocoris tenuis]
MDPYQITPSERARFEQQFNSLNPINGIVTGDQAKGFLLQSQLPPATLGIIWALADTDADGKMNINEFSIACKLINLKLRGFEIPKALPPSLLALANQPVKPPIPPLPSSVPPMASTPLVANLTGGSSSSIPPVSVQPMMASRIISPPSGGQSPLQVTAPPPIPPLPAQLTGGKNGSPAIKGMGMPLPTAGPPIMPIQPGGALPPLPPTPMPTMPPNIPPMVPPMSQAPGIPTQVIPPNFPPMVPPYTQAPGIPTQMASAVAAVPPAVPLMSAVPPTVPQMAAAIPPSTLSGLISSQTSPPSGPTPPTPPIVAPTLERERIGSFDSQSGITSPPTSEWAVPQASKLKYTQLFNTTDKSRTGFLTGVQSRSILLASKLPQAILAQIWGLADTDADGRLSCEEFVLALHLCDLARQGETLPASLPPNLVPPTLRRVRQNSLGSNSGAPGEFGDPMAGIGQTTFDDKRKENFEKGQAELDRRRKALLEIQRKEQAERERKEREEREKLEKIRLEQERKRQEEIERELERAKELEKAREEERKRAEEQREAARKEMERQRQLEWENNRRQELENQRRKAQETVLALKAKSQSLSIDLSQKDEKVKELSKQISETRCGVTSVKSIIDGMRSTRDQNLAEYNRLKALLKQRNQQLVALSQQKAKLEAQGKLGGKDSADDVLAFNNKSIVVKNLKDKISSLQEEVNSKMKDVENNNSQLDTLRKQLSGILDECEELYNIYAGKRNKMLELKGANDVGNDVWGNSSWDTAPAQAWPEDQAATDRPGYTKYRALYEFSSRNPDELSFQPGDIIYVLTNQQAEPGWLSGELRGNSGWFPESYVEPMDNANVDNGFANTTALPKTPLEGIAEIGEPVSDSGSGFGDDSKWNEPAAAVNDNVAVAETAVAAPAAQLGTYVALYPYDSAEPGDLVFDQGETITVIAMDGDWWTGTIGERSGIFPSNYVQAAEYPAAVSEPVQPVAIAQPVQEEKPKSPAVVEKAPAVEPKLTPTAIEAQIASERAATPDFASLASQFESGGEESDSNRGKPKKPVIATVIAPYQATSTEQLSLQRGQLIMIRKKTSTGWWEGELQAKGKKRQIGWFPASYVKLLAGGRLSQSQSRKTSESGLSDGLLERVIALYPYVAQNEDELSFEKDDIVTILAKDEPSWWKGECKGGVGVFPSNYVGPMYEAPSPTVTDVSPSPIAELNRNHRNSSSSSTSSIEPNFQQSKGSEKKRQQAIKELIQTEQAYIDDMSIVHEVFLKPLHKRPDLVTPEQLGAIFINWDEILQCNYAFLRSLRVRREMSERGVIRIIGDVLCENLPRMTVYIRFCSCQLRAAALLQHLTTTKPEFLELSKKCQSDPRTQGLPLSSFLIKPMQRITKYPLLISKILEHTKNGHPDKLYLEEALSKAEELCSLVNEGVREKENSERLEWLQTHVLSSDDLSEPLIFNSLTNALGPRKFLHFGTLIKVKSGKELIGFLMNDFLLLGKPNRPLGQFNFQKHQNVLFRIYKKPLLLSETTITVDGLPKSEIKLDHNKIVFHLRANSEHDRDLWLSKLVCAQRDMRKHELEKFTRQQSKQASFGAVGRILVMVLSGSNLKPRSADREVFCEVSMGAQEHRTPTVHMSSQTEVVFNASLQFLVKDLNEDVLCFTVKEKGNFSPDQFLGRTELRVSELSGDAPGRNGNRGPRVRQLRLCEVASGFINVKIDLHNFVP